MEIDKRKKFLVFPVTISVIQGEIRLVATEKPSSARTFNYLAVTWKSSLSSDSRWRKSTQPLNLSCKLKLYATIIHKYGRHVLVNFKCVFISTFIVDIREPIVFIEMINLFEGYY